MVAAGLIPKDGLSWYLTLVLAVHFTLSQLSVNEFPWTSRKALLPEDQKVLTTR